MSMQHNSSAAPNQGHDSDRFIRLPEVLKRTGVSKMTIARWESRGHFPKRVKISANIVAWRESEFNHWVSKCGSAATCELGDK